MFNGNQIKRLEETVRNLDQYVDRLRDRIYALEAELGLMYVRPNSEPAMGKYRKRVKSETKET